MGKVRLSKGLVSRQGGSFQICPALLHTERERVASVTLNEGKVNHRHRGSEGRWRGAKKMNFQQQKKKEIKRRLTPELRQQVIPHLHTDPCRVWVPRKGRKGHHEQGNTVVGVWTGVKKRKEKKSVNNSTNEKREQEADWL